MHDAEGCGAEAVLEALEVGGHERSNIGVDRGGRPAFVFAVFREDFVGGRDAEAGCAHCGSDCLFMLRASVGVKEADGNGGDFSLLQGGDEGVDFVGIEGLEYGSIGGDALVQAEGEIGGDQGLRAGDHKLVEFGAGLATYSQHVFEACGGDEGEAGALALQQGVGRDG